MPPNSSQTLHGFVYSFDETQVTWFGKLRDAILASLTYFQMFLDIRSFMIGKLVNIDKGRRRALVNLPNSNRFIWMKYPKNCEDMLMSNYNNFIEITGKIEVDRSIVPRSIRFVRQIELVDTSGIHVSEIMPPFLRLRGEHNPMIRVSLNESQSYYEADYEELNLIAGGYTRQEVKEELEAILIYQWQTLIQDTQTPVNNISMQIRKELERTFVEV